MIEKNNCLFEFGSFRIDLLKRQLLNDHKIVPLTAKAFAALSVLIQKRGEIVSKSDLMDTIWDDTAVEENNLTQQISTLRKVLGENSKENRFIATIPGKGYSFVASVKEIFKEEETEILLREINESNITIDFYENKSPETQKEQPGKSENSSLARPSHFVKIRALGFVALPIILLAGIFIWLYNSNGHSKSSPKTIAVLPFKSLNADEKDDFLSVGMTDTLITKLSSLQTLNVRPTSTVIKYANGNQDGLFIGRELRVDTVLEGTVQNNGDQIRVTVQMLDVESGKIIWSQSFDEKFSNVFTVQDAISEDVVAVLQLKLSDREQINIRRHSTGSIEAYQSYVRGRYFWNKRDEASLMKGIEYFQAAINHDPNYALAYSGITDSLLILDYYGLGKFSHEEIRQNARQNAQKALELDDSLAEAHTSLAFIYYFFEGNSETAETEFKRAIELNPNYATAHHWYSDFLAMSGRKEESLREIKIAANLDPVSQIINATLGERLFYLRRYDEAISQLNRTIEIDNDFSTAHYLLGMSFEQKGMFNEAIKELQKARSLVGENSEFDAVLAHIYALSGDKIKAEKILRELIKENQDPHALAIVYLGLGDESRALEWLKKLTDSKSRWFLRNDPRFDTLKLNPEFQRLSEGS